MLSWYNWFKKLFIKDEEIENEEIKKTLQVDKVVGLAPKNEIIDINKEIDEIKLIEELQKKNKNHDN